jgi:hypothetical protein
VAGLDDEEGFVFCTRNGTPFQLGNLRRDFAKLRRRAGLGEGWTTYELRHSFVSLVSDQLDDLVKVADLWQATSTLERPRATAMRSGRPCRMRSRGRTAGHRAEAS